MPPSKGGAVQKGEAGKLLGASFLTAIQICVV